MLLFLSTNSIFNGLIVMLPLSYLEIMKEYFDLIPSLISFGSLLVNLINSAFFKLSFKFGSTILSDLGCVISKLREI